MKLSRQEVFHIARLARLGLSEEEVTRLSRELSDILGHFEVLQQVDTEGVPPTAQAISLKNVMKYDEPAPSLEPGQVLANAPKSKDDFFRVKGILD